MAGKCFIFHRWTEWKAVDLGETYAFNFRNGPCKIEWRVCTKCGKVESRGIKDGSNL